MDKFLTPEEFSLDDIFKGRYRIPIYQRPYSWGEKQVKQLLKDIDEAYDNFKASDGQNADDSVLFAGTIFIKTEANIRNEYTEYTVVDGQQRITTLTLLLMAMLNKLYVEDSDDDIVRDIRNYLWKKEDRKNDKDKQVLSLGNIDEEILKSLLNELYSKNELVSFIEDKLEDCNNNIEINLMNNFLLINNHIKRFSDDKEFFNYIEFIRYNIKVISIKINTNMVKLFSIFESINSKGKPLEDIDLIKSYIFQNLNQSDYDEYLDKWGELIKQTNDSLNYYFTIFIRANVSYYRYAIKLDNFKTLAEGQLKRYYEKERLDEVLKDFINDMLRQVKYYTMLSDPEMLKVAGVSEKSMSYFRLNNIAKYNHTEPLLFKILSLRGTGISEARFDELVEYSLRFIVTYQTVSSRESKHTSAAFSDAQNELYNVAPNKDSDVNVDDYVVDSIKSVFDKRIYDNQISNDVLKNSIRSTMTYKKNKNVVKFLLAFLLEMNDEHKVDYIKLNAILDQGSKIHVDHILPQNPKADDDNFKYYPEDEFMMLKTGQDFTNNHEDERMPLDDFLSNYLHKFGNLRLDWANDNIRKSNHLIKLEEFDELFNSNNDITNREKELIENLIESNLLISVDNYQFNPNAIRAKRQIEISASNYEDVDLSKYRPVSFSIFGQNNTLGKFRYRQLLIELFDVLYDLEKERLAELAEQKYYPTSSDSAYISNKKEDVRQPYVLGNSVYIETNLSAEYLLYFAYVVIDEMGLDRDDLTITLEEK